MRVTLKKIDKRENEEIALKKLNEIIKTSFENSEITMIAESINKKIINNKLYIQFDS